MKKVIIVSASSDIGTALCRKYIDKGYEVYGTYRTKSQATDSLKSLGVKLHHCDLTDKENVLSTCISLRSVLWDLIVFCPGTQLPIGKFQDCGFDKWAESVNINFVSQMRFLHSILPFRKPGARCIFFAGGGTNNAPTHYSAYIVSKIALIKMVEILDAEIPDMTFAIMGPGWVKTKIHHATLDAGLVAGTNYLRTVERLQGDNLTPMKTVVECCEWIESAPRRSVGGRNISLVDDPWGTPDLNLNLECNPNMFKLRRYKNTISLEGIGM